MADSKKKPPLIIKATPADLKSCPIALSKKKNAPKAACVSSITMKIDKLSLSSGKLKNTKRTVSPVEQTEVPVVQEQKKTETPIKPVKDQIPKSEENKSEMIIPQPIESPQEIEILDQATKKPVNYYQGRGKSVLMFLPHPCKLQFCGYLKITICHGHVYIFGTNLNFNSRFRTVTMFGSKESKSIMVETKESNDNDTAVLQLFIKKHMLHDSSEIVSKLRPEDAVIFIEEIDLPALFLSKRYISPELYPTSYNHTIFPEISKWVKCRIDHEGGSVYTAQDPPQSWRDLPLSDRMMVIGGGSLGKSTLTKFLINRLLEKHHQVLYLELDLGQGDYIPPGTIGSVLIREPAIGPNYSRVLPHECLMHLGDVNVNNCMKAYFECTSYLCRNTAKHYSNVPVVVNTMGYSKGVGHKIASKIIKIIQPKTLIQMECDDMPSKNFNNHFTPEFLSTDGQPMTFDFILLKTIYFLDKEKKRARRNRKFLSSWSSMLTPPHYSFNSAKTFRVSFSSIIIGVNQSLALTDILRALNACLVAMCEAPRMNLKELNTNSGYFRIVLKPDYQKCLSLGLVRGIDVENKEIYIISPLTQMAMRRVKMLVMSGIEVPPEILLDQDIFGEVPYVARNSNAVANAPIVRRYQTDKKIVS